TMEPDTSKHLWWLEEISDTNLLSAVRKLSLEQIELLDMYVFDSLSQTDIARRLGVNQSSVSRQLNKIKEILIDFHA
ncbi:MAG: sigma-70 family RNA polymerase sigma factor, partial [Alistipes sp.]|nr:sigma-70 family RNA polymerase sigma factor [Alistipes sp.]